MASASPIRETVAGRRASDSSAALLQRSPRGGLLCRRRVRPGFRSHSVAPTPHHFAVVLSGPGGRAAVGGRGRRGDLPQVVPPLFSISPQVRDVSATALRRGSPREGTPALSLLRGQWSQWCQAPATDRVTGQLDQRGSEDAMTPSARRGSLARVEVPSRTELYVDRRFLPLADRFFRDVSPTATRWRRLSSCTWAVRKCSTSGPANADRDRRWDHDTVSLSFSTGKRRRQHRRSPTRRTWVDRLRRPGCSVLA